MIWTTASRVAPQLLADWHRGNWHPGLCEYAWQQVDKAPCKSTLYTALKIQNAIAGMRASDLDYALSVVEQLDCRWHAVTLRLISSCLQLQRKDLACQLVAQQLTGAVTPIRSYLLLRNPTVLALMYELDPDRFSWRLRSRVRSAYLLIHGSKPLGYQLFATLDKSIDTRSTITVAIVGNSPVLLSRADGREIDSHDLVIRFNNVHLHQKVLPHTGSKTDLLMLSPEASRTIAEVAVQPLAISGVNPWHGNSRYWQRFAALNQPTHHVCSNVWHSLVERLRAPPSSGLLALACLSQDNNVRVRAFGLTNREQFSVATQGLHYADTQKSSSRHNWKLEADLVSELTHEDT